MYLSINQYYSKKTLPFKATFVSCDKIILAE